MDATAELLGLAFAKSPAVEANEAISRVREEQSAEQSGATSYELVLPSEDVRAFLLERTLPRLVDYLESTRAKLPDCAGVFLSVFSGDTLYFIHARDAVAMLSQWSGLSMDELRRRYGPR
ncbi:MAG: hypothetical protein L0Y66_04550 [Myxococcaceae bacterium]|nr:hypothetical protein [Myxococcaceae bacterium]MCI0668994.1 hypothetical protein [Myxococcaceae bacterium]